MTDNNALDSGGLYEIRVEGGLDPSWSDWFDGFSINYLEDETQLVGMVPDQAALLGLLAKIGRLNLPLRSIQRLENRGS